MRWLSRPGSLRSAREDVHLSRGTPGAGKPTVAAVLQRRLARRCSSPAGSPGSGTGLRQWTLLVCFDRRHEWEVARLADRGPRVRPSRGTCLLYTSDAADDLLCV